jgi:hypothetical protein
VPGLWRKGGASAHLEADAQEGTTAGCAEKRVNRK